MTDLPKKYSFPPIADPNSRILLLGSLPSVLSLQRRQFYGNSQNHFWRLIYAIFEQPYEEDYEQRVCFLLSRRIALWDSIRSATNPGSQDSTLKNIYPNDFRLFFKEYPRIKHIFFNGGKSEEVFKKNFPEYYLSYPHTRLPSSSPIPTSKIRNITEKLPYWMVIRDILENLP